LADNIKEANVPDHSADVILSIGALHHMTDMDEVFRSLKRYAKPGTVLVAVEPQRGNPLIQLLRFIRGRMDGDYSEEQHFFSKEELAALFQRNGLQDVELRYHYYLTPPFAQVVFQPQAIFEPLSRLAVRGDRWLGRKMPAFLQPLSFNLIATGQFT
jgi:SAM-dependent methyltransferase